VNTVSAEWYQHFFGSAWLDFATQQFSLDYTQSQVDFILDAAGIKAGASILDLACGHGRHSIELARRGYRVVGLDLSEPSLEIARAAADRAGVPVNFIHGDMRRIPYRHEFDLVINLFTAFGYLESEEEDQKVLDSIHRALKPGGCVIIDTINHSWLMRHFEPRGWTALEDGLILLEERTFDLRSGRSNATWTLLYPDGQRHELNHSLRVYTLVEFEANLDAAGLILQHVWGNYERAPYGLDTHRMILLAKRV
jgi:2-polyprenyl-3-methyl-5-hydroxy-6-metoxy-1,4-benzoquinol methylase